MGRIVVTCALALCAALPAAARADTGDVIVRYRTSADASDRADARRDADVQRQDGLPVSRMELVDPEPGVSAAKAAATLDRDPDVLYAEVDAPRRVLTVPDDTLFRAQWGLDNYGQTLAGSTGTPDADIDAPEAWDVTTGSPSVVVAVVDSGIDTSHPDLAPNIFRNTGEIAGNLLDDDHNGYVDDVGGWDFYDWDSQPLDENGHGTHVAGTIAARGNDGTGVTGVAWQASLLPLRALGPDGGGTVSDAIRAYAYAAAMGARIVNLSLGGDTLSRAERDAIANASRTLFVTASGNDGEDNDVVGSYPCEYELPNVVCVAATDSSDRLADFSNYGARSVDLGAPGVNIASAWFESPYYAYLDGTSMATPFVSGVAALLFSRVPSATVADVRSALLAGVDPIPSLSGLTVTGGRLNAAKALAAITGQPSTADGAARVGDGSAPDGGAGGASQPAQQPAPTQTGSQSVAVTPSTLPDRSAPLVSIRRAGRQLRIHCSERCTVKLSLRRGKRVVWSRTVRRSSAGWMTVRVARSATGRLALRLLAYDAVGNKRTATRRFTLKRR